MEELIIQDDYNKWFDGIIHKSEKELLLLNNWKYIFQKMNLFISNAFIDYELKINCFKFLTQIITMKLVTGSTEMKTFFNSLVHILIMHLTHNDVNNNIYLIYRTY